MDSWTGIVTALDTAGVLVTPDVEPVAEPWTLRRLDDLVGELLRVLGPRLDRPRILAVDGRSAGGKSTLAARLAAAGPDSTVIHTDDIAWYESFFGWDTLLAENILEPLRRGEAISYRPPAWEARGRDGAIAVPAGRELVIVEGVGASRRSVQRLLDGAVWVQSDLDEARRRGLIRDGGDGAVAFWDEWSSQELPFLAEDRPWQRALMVVCGTPQITGIPHDPDTELLVGARS